MTYGLFDRKQIHQFPLEERKNKVTIKDIYVKPTDPEPDLTSTHKEVIHTLAGYILDAREAGKSVMLSFGAHSIKNGLGPLMVEMASHGWITHLATNGAGIIHDWEFAFQGKSSESVAENLPKGKFGTWQETGFYLNLAIIAGVYEGLGYGAAVGKAIAEQGLQIPSKEELEDVISRKDDLEKVAAAADFLRAVRDGGLTEGWLPIPEPYGDYSLQAGAYRLGVSSTDHPMFGHDIIYTHYLNNGDAIGRAAERDFLSFVHSMEGLDGGVYLSLGSAIMSPMVFEKGYAMVQNVRRSQGSSLDGHHIAVVDLGEPALMRIFSRTCPASMDYLVMDNRTFLLALYHELSNIQGNE